MEKVFYLAKVFDGLHVLALILTILGVIISVIAVVNYFDLYEGSAEAKDFRKLVRSILVVTAISILCLIFVPDRRTYLFMVGGKIVDTAIETNPEILEIPENTISLVNEYIKSETQFLRSKNNENSE